MASPDSTAVHLPSCGPAKRCTLCGETKPLALFYGNPMGALGRTSRCRECIRLLDRQKRAVRRAAQAPYVLPLEKRCTRCGTVMALEAFHRDRRAKDGRQIVCKRCQTLQARAWSRAHRGTLRSRSDVEALAGDVLYSQRTCERCGTPFWVRGTWPRQRRRFCSRSCFNPALLDEPFFATWSDDLAWLIGLIWSDGCLSKRGDEVSISSKDRGLLVTAATLAGQDIPIYPATQGRKFVVHFYGRSLCTRLRAIGLTPAKSLTIGWPLMPEQHQAAFVRGVMDGDGSVLVGLARLSPYPTLRVSIVTGSPLFRDALRAWMHRQGLRAQTYVKSGNCWRVDVCAQDSLAHLHALLYPSPDVPCLRRKREPFDAWMATPRAHGRRPCDVR